MSWAKYLWDIDEREDRSEREAAYINGVIRWMEAKFDENYRRILDVPCGNGRLHPFLKKFGYEVDGIDISEELVEEARKNGHNCWVGDMSDPEAYPKKKYDVMLNWFTSIGYRNGRDDKKTMKIWRNHLREGGIVIVDAVPPSAFIMDHIVSYDSRVKIFQEKGDEKHRHIHIRMFRDLGNRMELLAEHRVDLLLYSPEEMEKMLERAGFEVVTKLSGMTFRRWDGSRTHIVYLARKTRIKNSVKLSPVNQNKKRSQKVKQR